MSVQRRSSTHLIRPTAAFASVAAVGLVLAGCSGGDGGSGSADGGDQTLQVLIAAPQEGAGNILEQEFEAATRSRRRRSSTPSRAPTTTT